MSHIGKWMIVAGGVIAGLGLVFWILGKAGFRGLPGDIHYDSGRTQVYFPIVTCLVASAVLSAIFWVWQWFQKR